MLSSLLSTLEILSFNRVFIGHSLVVNLLTFLALIGMNEVAASFVVIYFTEALGVREAAKNYKGSRGASLSESLLDLDFAEADVFSAFNRMMELGHLEMFRPCLSVGN